MMNNKEIPANYYRQTTPAGISDRNQTTICLSSKRDNISSCGVKGHIPTITRTQFEHLPPFETCVATVSAECGYLRIIDDDNLCGTCTDSGLGSNCRNQTRSLTASGK